MSGGHLIIIIQQRPLGLCNTGIAILTQNHQFVRCWTSQLCHSGLCQMHEATFDYVVDMSYGLVICVLYVNEHSGKMNSSEMCWIRPN